MMDMFFFSSRRRHTRYIGDWSSDVCSSDLTDRIHAEIEACRLAYTSRNMYVADPAYADVDVDTQIGRASCRERV